MTWYQRISQCISQLKVLINAHVSLLLLICELCAFHIYVKFTMMFALKGQPETYSLLLQGYGCKTT